MTKDTEALQRRSAEPSDGEIYSLASFGGDANAKARFVAGLIEKVEQALATPASDVAPVEYETLIAAGFDEYAAHCALRTEPDGGFCHAYFYSDGQWRFQTGGNDLTLADGTILRCVLTKRLFAHPPLAQSVDPVAVLQYDKVTCGNENEMPKVISCNWLPDGEYPVFLAAPVPVEPVAGGEALREAVRDALASELGDTYDCGRVWEAWSVGTMGEDDFTPVNDRVDEIADAILAALKGPAA